MAWWDDLESRTLPERGIPLRVGSGTTMITIRALPDDEWRELCAQHPATGEGALPGQVDTQTLRDPLIAASVVAPEGSPPRSAAWWTQQVKAGAMTSGEVDALFDAVWALNRDAPVAPDLGKG